MTSLEGKAKAFLALHRPGDPAVLPTVWDAWSAKVAVDAGFAALTWAVIRSPTRSAVRTAKA